MSRRKIVLLGVVVLIALAWILAMTGCRGGGESERAAPRSAPVASKAPVTPPSSAPAPPKAPATPPSSAPPAPEPAPGVPAETVAVAATKPGLTRVGADKCKMCHRLQYESWVATAHATRIPPLDCESCHGPGSEYKTVSIMKDSAKAKAAGLVIPNKSFCTGSCHKDKWQDDMVGRAHAHKNGAGSAPSR